MARGQLRIVDPNGEEPAVEDEIAEALAAIGLRAEGELEIEEVFELWPDNVPTFKFWKSIQTQWRHAGMTGVKTGLDYQGVKICMSMQRIPKNDQAEIFAGLQVMETASLNEWNRQQ